MAFGPVNKGGAEGPWPNPEKRITKYTQVYTCCIQHIFDPFGPLNPRTYLNIYFPLLFPVLPCVFVPVQFLKLT